MPTRDWTCPFCNKNATITDDNSASDTATVTASNFDRVQMVRAHYIRCPNPNCHQYTLRVISGYQSRYGFSSQRSWQLFPESMAKPFPDYIPAPIIEDYQEACLIKDKSPKASATLSRRCLQGMIRDFHNIREKNLYLEIDALRKKIDTIVYKAIDAVREFGNIGAHMEKDVNVIVDVEPEEAELLIKLIERLMSEWYIERHNRDQDMSELAELVKKKKQEKEDAKTKKAEEKEAPAAT